MLISANHVLECGKRLDFALSCTLSRWESLDEELAGWPKSIPGFGFNSASGAWQAANALDLPSTPNLTASECLARCTGVCGSTKCRERKCRLFLGILYFELSTELCHGCVPGAILRQTISSTLLWKRASRCQKSQSKGRGSKAGLWFTL